MVNHSRASRPPHHGMVVHAYYPNGESRVEREAKALLQQGYEVDVYCLQLEGEPASEPIDGIQVYRLPVKRHRGQGLIVQSLEYAAFFILVFFRLAVMQFKNRYASVQVHNLPDLLVFSALVPKLGGAKVLLDLHDLMPEFYAGQFGTGLDSLPVKIMIWQEKLACWFADHVITVTELWRQALIQRGVPPEKVSVVMNVADRQIFTKNGYHRETSNKNGFLLIYHGTLTERYGVDLLVQAVDQLRQAIPGLRLIIHGRGEFLERLQEMVAERSLDGCISFSTHYMPVNDLPRLIRQADLGVVPYRRNIFTDGILPTKLMEYVALGVPVLAARTPIIMEYFDDTQVQYFTAENVDELAQNILALYHQPERRAELARNADRFNQEYSWEHLAGRYAGLVDRLNGF